VPVPTTNIEIELECVPPNQWKDKDTGQDATNLVSQLNGFSDFQPKIQSMQAAKVKVTIES
jgi:hypothetical protein